MKTIFTLLLSTLFSLSSLAYDGTRLTVTSISNQKIFVEVDGHRYHLNDKTISLSNIRPGTHNVRVLKEVKRRNGWNLGSWNKKEEVIYSIRLTMKSGYHFDILVNRFGKVMIDERRIDRNDDWYDDEDYYDNDRNRNDDYDRDDHDYDDEYNRDSRDHRDRQYDNYKRAMNDRDFSMAKESLRKEWFENSRLAQAKQIIEQNNFTSQQVKELMMLFTFENNRLEVAKYAYGKTIDKRNYFIVNEALTFSRNKEQLNQYIREYDEKY